MNDINRQTCAVVLTRARTMWMVEKLLKRALNMIPKTNCVHRKLFDLEVATQFWKHTKFDHGFHQKVNAEPPFELTYSSLQLELERLREYLESIQQEGKIRPSDATCWHR